MIPAISQKSHKKVVIGVVGLLMVVLIVAVVYLLSSPKTIGKLAQPALQRNEQNTSRQNDVNKLMSAIATFIDGHGGAFPQQTATNTAANTIDLCEADCSDANKVPVTLGYYKNTVAAISFAPYTAGLQVPDTETVYIIPKASCNGTKTGIGEASSSVAILYGLSTNSGVQQQCLDL